MISDGNVHEEDWFEVQIVRTDVVTADNYADQRELGLYEYSHPEIPSGTDVITVRYRDEDYNLMWLDTIPILADDVWIDGVANMYLASARDAGVTRDDLGWTAFFQDIDESKKYLWNYEIVRYRDGKTDSTEPAIVARWTGSGMGVKSVTEYYLFSDKNNDITTSDSGWSETLTSDPVKRYLWNYEKIEYTTGETTLTSPTIIGTNGMKGDTGAKGNDGSRGGQYWGRTTPASPVKGDIYLDVTKMYLMEYNGTTWATVPYTDTRYTQAVQDIIASATDSAQLMQIANAWVANLVAGTVLANQLMAKNLTVLDGGSIQSQNYKAGTSGWKIDSNGRAEFENGVFRGEVNATSGVFNNIIVLGDSVFKGDIISGPLILNNNNPATIDKVYKFNQGESSQKLYEYISSLGGSANVDGKIISNNGYAVSISYIYLEQLWNGINMRCRDKDYNLIQKLVWWRNDRLCQEMFAIFLKKAIEIRLPFAPFLSLSSVHEAFLG